MAVCSGNRSEHCCWIAGVVCPHLIESDTGRRWSCGLLVAHGTWDAVYATAEYQATDAAVWFAEAHPGYGCGDWPQNIPSEMEQGIGLCCWQTEVEVSL